MTDRQVQAVSKAISDTLPRHITFTFSQHYANLFAQAAIPASDAKYVPMLVEACKAVIKWVEPRDFAANQYIHDLMETLASLPEEYRK